MKELKITNLHKTYGTKTLLGGVDLSIRTGDRIGLIGPNGTGKSSLLKVIANIDTYDEGEILKPNDYRIGYLDQHPELDLDKTILETVYDSPAPQIQKLLRYEKARLDLENDPENPTNFDRFTKMSDEMNLNNGWEIEVNAKTILSQLGLNDLSRLVSTCSGGERKRIGIAQVLISEPDLLILDEPTNHLDISSIQWLEKYLATYKGALLLVTHDRYFLERSVNKIVELNFGKLREYSGNYQDYLTKRSEEAANNERMQEKQNRLFQQELSWMRKGAKARTTKQQARINRFEDLKGSIESRNQADEAIDFNFDQQRIGQRIMDLENVTVEIGDKTVIENFTKSFIKGERLGIIGENGIGKSTFLNTLAGLHPITSGVYEIGQTVKMAYYRQLDQDLPGEMRVLKYLTQIADEFQTDGGQSVSAASMLEQFNFPRVTHGTQIKYLSGGERRRLYLLTLLIQEPNVLFLDEPTNDLDIETLTVLEDYLDSFVGVVIIVSHDRYFIDKTVDQLLDIQGEGKFKLIYGNYSDYLNTQSKPAPQTEKTESKEAPKKEVEKVKTEKKRMSYNEKKEWATIEKDIEETEAEIETTQAEMATQGSDAYRLMELQEKVESLELALLEYYERYEYLSELSL
ncbi:ABC-F family ATP-binding cassette domain-containing protein [Ruoffia tabacinasalis]|uniref:ABC-F family ATP-binding cassette domain-containing protein n=1 Tax=Ruoffia tabacinasalis TaxID=87458 RepID=A0A5R9EGB1_9LACT|nr:ABC-F family ATP-binding cassette domain-containing protein [Ruoffia tabacinasalis]TLQ49565.1 ABC-F family ATP-binding cassette domain-containing protein [Ruoffia tabacinasalis]